MNTPRHRTDTEALEIPDAPESSETGARQLDARAKVTHRTALATMVMAAGTIFSRASGLIRSFLLVMALGGFLHADIFQIANTVPNMLYILVAGGIFNAVLVPQLVRAMKNDADQGAAYINRIVTLAGLFLIAVTILLVLSAPWLMSLFLDSRFATAELAAQRDSVVAFARYCLPQVFFYGMFVLVGQVLNARGRFGPMMWAPIANNVISVIVIGSYLLIYGGYREELRMAPFSTGQELLLGLGSTLGIAVQFLILIPYLRRAGYSYRPRFDFRNSGLGHTLRLGVWTVLFVLVNQIAFVVVNRLASGGSAQGDAGITVYSNAYLVVMVPHSIITVSLATAILPQLSRYASERDFGELAWTIGSTLRNALVVVLPFAALLPVLAGDIAHVLWPKGQLADGSNIFAPTLALFAPALVFFTVHYLILRGFYALEGTRTVFWIQCVVAVVNIVAAVLLTRSVSPEHVAAVLAVAYGIAYLVASMLSYAVLSRTLGGLDRRADLVFLGRMVLALATAAVVALGVEHLMSDGVGWFGALFRGGIAGLSGLAIAVLMAFALEIEEVTKMVRGVGSAVIRGVRRR